MWEPLPTLLMGPLNHVESSLAHSNYDISTVPSQESSSLPDVTWTTHDAPSPGPLSD